MAAITAMTVLAASCSDTLQRRYDRMHGTSSGESSYRSSRTDDNDRNYRTADGAYRKDYDRVVEGSGTDTRTYDSGTSGFGTPGTGDYNQRLLGQYAEMDKLAEVVLYELDNLDGRYNNLLTEYRNAKPSSRQAMSMQLDRISDDRLLLYRAYTNIYRNGKSDWVNVKRDVENTLREVRRN